MPLNLREHNVMIRRMRNDSDAFSKKEQRIVSSYDDFDRKNRIETLVKGLILDDFDLPLPPPRPESNSDAAAGDSTKEDEDDEWENDFGEGSDCAAMGAASSNTSLAAKLAKDDPPSASVSPSSPPGPPPSTEASPAPFATASCANDDDEEEEDVSVRRGSSFSSASSSSEPSYSSEYFSSSTDSEEMELSALARRHLSAVKAKWPRDDHATKSKCSNTGICPPRRLHSPPPSLPPTPPRSHLVEKPDRAPCSVERVSSDDPALHREALVRSHDMPSPAELTRSTGSSASVMSNQNRRKVRFGCLEVRNYPIVLGDHPDCSAGPPISIGWKYSPGRTVSVDQYEAERSGSRRELDDMALSYMTRRKLLRRRRVSDEDMRRAAEEVCKVRKRRERTARWSTGKLARVDEVTESARKALGHLRPSKMKRRSKSSSDVLQRSRSSSSVLQRTKSSPAVLETSSPKRTGRRSSV